MHIQTPWGPIHWCAHETQMLMMMVPFFGVIILWVKSKFKKHNNHCHAEHKCCEDKK